jgi:hypothetical protein
VRREASIFVISFGYGDLSVDDLEPPRLPVIRTASIGGWLQSAGGWQAIASAVDRAMLVRMAEI